MKTIKIYLSGLLFLLSVSLSAQQFVSLQEVRTMVINNRIPDALSGYSQLLSQDSTNIHLLPEYAYALALGGAFDCALMNLDRVRMVSPQSTEGAFFTVLVFSLMEQNQLSDELKKTSKAHAPRWIAASNYLEQIKKYRQMPVLTNDDYKTALKRVNHLTASGLYLQAIALSEEIIRNYPSEYLSHVGYSIVLEKTGLYQKAATEMESATQMMSDHTDLTEAKTIFEKRTLELKEKSQSPQNFKNKLLKLKNDFNPQTMVYAGGMFTESAVSFNSRLGLFLNNSFNGALDLGMMGTKDNTSVNIGLSGYKRFGFLVWGEGLSMQFAQTSILNLKSSLGLSFINRKRNASWDIFFDWYLPLGEGRQNYGISIGRSFYFGNR